MMSLLVVVSVMRVVTVKGLLLVVTVTTSWFLVVRMALMMMKTTMGRCKNLYLFEVQGKISMQPIANNKARRVTFVKRKNGLKKKLHELTTLCDIEVCMICFDGDDGTVETWPEDQRKFNGVIQKYKRVGRIEREKNCVNVEGQLEARKKKLEDNCGWDQRLDDLSKESLSELGCSLNCQLEKVRERVHQLNNLNHENSNSALVDETHPTYFGDNSVMIGSPSNYYYDNQQFTMAECYGTDNDDQTDFSGVAQPIMIQPPPLQQAMPWSQDATTYLYSL